MEHTLTWWVRRSRTGVRTVCPALASDTPDNPHRRRPNRRRRQHCAALWQWRGPLWPLQRRWSAPGPGAGRRTWRPGLDPLPPPAGERADRRCRISPPHAGSSPRSKNKGRDRLGLVGGLGGRGEEGEEEGGGRREEGGGRGEEGGIRGLSKLKKVSTSKICVGY